MEGTLDGMVEQASELGPLLVRGGVDADECEAVELLLRSVRRWASGLSDADIDARAAIPDSVYDEAAQLGLFGLTVPTGHEGAGLSLLAAGRVIEELARHDRSVATSIGLHCGLGLRGLIRFGTDAQKSRYLPGLARGEDIAAFAATEPAAGSHLAGVRTVCMADAGGELRLSGEKCFVTNGGRASVFTILARTPGLGGVKRGHSLILVNRGQRGLSIGPEEHKLGLRGSSTTSLHFDDIVIARDAILGEPSRGLDQIADLLAWGRTLMSAGCVGTAATALERAVRQGVERRQFGRPIGTFGLVRQKIAEMETRRFAMQSIVRLVGALQSRGRDIGLVSLAAKIFASEGVGSICDDALQIHGGSGFIEDVGVARLVRDARITRIFEGSNEVLRYHLGMGGLISAKSSSSLAPQVHTALEGVAECFDQRRRRTSDAVAALLARHGLRVEGHQLLLGGLADALAGLVAQLAVYLRIDSALRAGADNERTDWLERSARHTDLLFGRQIEQGLRQMESEAEERLVERISDDLYQDIAS